MDNYANLYLKPADYFRQLAKSREIEGLTVMCKKIKELAGKTPEELLLGAGIYDIPVNLKKLTEHWGIEVGSMDFAKVEQSNGIKEIIEKKGSILGAVVVKDDDISIFYAENRTSPNRARFTIAHEIAHCCLHAEQLKAGHIQFRNDNVDPDEDERAANTFAGRLLVPTDKLNDCLREMKTPFSNLLAGKFRVSTKVMNARLDDLGIEYYSLNKPVGGN